MGPGRRRDNKLCHNGTTSLLACVGRPTSRWSANTRMPMK
jgi:hypothetical protein